MNNTGEHNRQTASSGNVFEDLGFPPEEAANLKIRAVLMLQIRDYIKKHGLKQKEAAERLGIKQPEVSAINTGKIDRFTIDALINLLTRIGHQVDIKSTKKRRTFSIIESKKPVVYQIKTESGKTNYVGVAKRGRVQERLSEHLDKNSDNYVPSAKVSITQKDTLAEAKKTESGLIKKNQPLHNKQGNRASVARHKKTAA